MKRAQTLTMILSRFSLSPQLKRCNHFDGIGRLLDIMGQARLALTCVTFGEFFPELFPDDLIISLKEADELRAAAWWINQDGWDAAAPSLLACGPGRQW